MCLQRRPPKYKLNKDDTSGHTKLDEEVPMRPQPHAENYGELSKAGSSTRGPPWGQAHPKAEPTNWLSSSRFCFKADGNECATMDFWLILSDLITE